MKWRRLAVLLVVAAIGVGAGALGFAEGLAMGIRKGQAWGSRPGTAASRARFRDGYAAGYQDAAAERPVSREVFPPTPIGRSPSPGSA